MLQNQIKDNRNDSGRKLHKYLFCLDNAVHLYLGTVFPVRIAMPRNQGKYRLRRDIQGLRLDLFAKVWYNKLTENPEFDEVNHE